MSGNECGIDPDRMFIRCTRGTRGCGIEHYAQGDYERVLGELYDREAFKRWWCSSEKVTGDENTAWLAWQAALEHAAQSTAEAK